MAVQLPEYVQPFQPVVASPQPADWTVTTVANNATATAIRAAEAGKAHHIAAIIASYNTPATGLLTLKEGSALRFQRHVSGANSPSLSFAIALKLATNTAAELSLPAGGIAVTGAVTLIGYTL